MAVGLPPCARLAGKPATSKLASALRRGSGGLWWRCPKGLAGLAGEYGYWEDTNDKAGSGKAGGTGNIQVKVPGVCMQPTQCGARQECLLGLFQVRRKVPVIPCRWPEGGGT